MNGLEKIKRRKKLFTDRNFLENWKRAARWLARVRPVYWLILVAAILALFLILLPPSDWPMLWKAVVAQRFVVGMLGVFGLLAISLIWKTGQRIDVWFFHFINTRGRRPAWLDGLMLGFTQMGNGVFAYALALVLYFAVRHLLAYELVFGNLTLWLTVELIKVLVRRVRPYKKLSGIRILGSRERGTSFPSGHTSQAFFMASLLSHYFQTGFPITLLLYTAALLVGITRMYVGMHYPRDVFGGAILGTTWGLLGVTINSYLFTELNIH